MTVKEAAQHLELSLWTVYKLLQSGKLGCPRIGPGNGKIVLTDQHIQQYRQSCERRGSVGVGR